MEIDRFDIKKAVEWKDKLEQNCSLEEILWIIRNISYDYVSYYSAKDNGYIYQHDDFDEEDFEELSERYLTKVYNNVNSFKLSKASLNKEGKLKLEGIVTFKSGNKRKTAFLFEKKNSLKSGKIKYIGENLDFSNGRKSFILNCSVNNKKLISESLTYNYTVKDNDGQSKRLYGTVRRNK